MYDLSDKETYPDFTCPLCGQVRPYLDGSGDCQACIACCTCDPDKLHEYCTPY